MAGFMPLKEAAAMKEGLRVTGVPGLPGIWIAAQLDRSKVVMGGMSRRPCDMQIRSVLLIKLHGLGFTFLSSRRALEAPQRIQNGPPSSHHVLGLRV